MFARFGILLTTIFMLTAFTTPETSTNTPTASTKVIVNEMLKSISKIKTLSYRFKQNERMKSGKRNIAEVKVKYQRNPTKVYIKCVSPDEGVELLWNGGDRKAYVNPNSFFIPNVSLDIYGSRLLRGKQHHPIEKTGFDFLASIVKNALTRTDVSFEDGVKLLGSDTYDGQECYLLEIVDPSFHFRDYTVKANEDLMDIAKKFHIGEYMILENNPKVSDYFDVEAGQTIKIPSSYAKRTVLHINKSTHLPVKQMMYDDNGLYESYEFLDLKVNPTIDATEFTSDYEEYGY